MSSNTPATKLQIQNEYIYKKSDEHRVNIVNVTLNHRHKKAKKHKEKKSQHSAGPTNKLKSEHRRKKNHTVMERIANTYI